ncbi:MAG TPA: hypothetical protein VLG16_00445 [Candidatus Saccharimonadales bacterium]|nr:hypothetical protein [Candidatus Saccharimonadales bacterium]
MSPVETCDYPESEARLESWEQEILNNSDNKNLTVVKLAFRSLGTFTDTRLRQAAHTGDFQTAYQSLIEAGETRHSLSHSLSQKRFATNEGHRYIQLHATSTATSQERTSLHPPHPKSAYWRTLSMLFAYLHGPLGGEAVYAIPPALDEAVGLSQQEYETTVILSDSGKLLGASAVTYNPEGTNVVYRNFYKRDHDVAGQASDIAKAILAHQDLETMRVPQAWLPDAIQQEIGLYALNQENYTQPQNFDDLLPPALRD